ncbi:MAG: hypothetical protein KAJ60_01910 [Desulfobulbaceae bacterium]|nr:hypothetical protein [Desulfobulbaceae bacterium]
MKKFFIWAWFALAFTALTIPGLTGSASAQSTLNAQQKIQVVNLAANAAAQQVNEKKDFPLARLLLLSAIEPAFRIIPAAASNPQVGATINQFAGASLVAWPDAPKQPDPQAMNAFFKTFETNKAEVAKLAAEFNIFNIPNGKEAYRRKVANIKARGDEVSKYMSDMVKDSPPAAHFLMSPPHLQMGMTIFNQLFNIVFGQIFVGEHVKKIVPELIQEADTHIKTAKASKKVSEIGLQLADARKAVALLKIMDGKNAEISSIEEGINAGQEHLNKVYDAQVAENRVPADVWKGSDADRKRILDEAKAQYAKLSPEDEIIKIHITSEAFGEGWEAWWDRDDVWRAAYAGYVKTAAVVKHKSGSYRVVGQSFRRTLSGNDWTSLRNWKFLYNFKILPENM